MESNFVDVEKRFFFRIFATSQREIHVKVSMEMTKLQSLLDFIPVELALTVLLKLLSQTLHEVYA